MTVRKFVCVKYFVTLPDIENLQLFIYTPKPLIWS